MKLAKTVSLNSTLSEEVADLRATFETCESKWYDKGFTDAECGAGGNASSATIFPGGLDGCSTSPRSARGLPS